MCNLGSVAVGEIEFSDYTLKLVYKTCTLEQKNRVNGIRPGFP